MVLLEREKKGVEDVEVERLGLSEMLRRRSTDNHLTQNSAAHWLFPFWKAMLTSFRVRVNRAISREDADAHSSRTGAHLLSIQRPSAPTSHFFPFFTQITSKDGLVFDKNASNEAPPLLNLICQLKENGFGTMTPECCLVSCAVFFLPLVITIVQA